MRSYTSLRRSRRFAHDPLPASPLLMGTIMPKAPDVRVWFVVLITASQCAAILPSSKIVGTDFWVLTEILRGMMPKIPTGWLARTVKLNGVLPIAALCLICKTEGPILRVGPRRQSRRASRPLRQGEGNSNIG